MLACRLVGGSAIATFCVGKWTKKVGVLRALPSSFRNLGDRDAKLGGARASLGYDAAVVSPIFFGYTSTTEADVDEACAKVKMRRTLYCPLFVSPFLYHIVAYRAFFGSQSPAANAIRGS